MLADAMRTGFLTRVLAVSLVGSAAAVAQTTAADKADAAALQGVWVLVSAVANGKREPDGAAGGAMRTTHGDTTIVMAGEKMVLKATFRVDTSMRPKQIEFRVLGGEVSRGVIQLGIYEVKGQTLQLCISRPGALRAREFVSREGDYRACTVWKRSKG